MSRRGVLALISALLGIGAFAEKKKIYVAYHTHLQGSMTAFDQAFAVSKGNMANVDLGHFVAAGGDRVRLDAEAMKVQLDDHGVVRAGLRLLLERVQERIHEREEHRAGAHQLSGGPSA